MKNSITSHIVAISQWTLRTTRYSTPSTQRHNFTFVFEPLGNSLFHLSLHSFSCYNLYCLC